MLLIELLVYLGRDIIKHSKESIDRCFEAEVSKKQQKVKIGKIFFKWKPDAKPVFCAARKVPLPLERNVNKAYDEFLLLGFL